MAPRNDNPRAPGLTLRDAFIIFWRRPSPRIFLGLLAHTIMWRIFAGPLSTWDAVVVGLIVLLHPLTEWLIHVFILHFRPRKFGRFTLDFKAAKDHRDHHSDPHDHRVWFIPIQSHVTAFVGLFVVSHLLLPRPLAATLMLTAVVVGLVYEWTHYICHSSYRPKSKFVAQRVKHHTLHHFKNEKYWMGVTLHGADALLGTKPAKGDVETSPTCRSLLGDEEV